MFCVVAVVAIDNRRVKHAEFRVRESCTLLLADVDVIGFLQDSIAGTSQIHVKMGSL